MKTEMRRAAMILATVLTLAAAYLGGMLVSAQTTAAPTGPQAPAITNAQWAAVAAANALLLDDDTDDPTVYLPMVLRRCCLQ